MHDDWYTIATPHPGLTAVGEPRYEQQNWSYLITGTTRALLFDTGSHFGKIAPVVARFTDLPLTVLPSHMHYDHLGNITAFDQIALPDLPVLRDCEDGGHVTPTETLFLGAHENRTAPRFAVSDWLTIGSAIELGGVTLTLLHTPGHSPDSVSLWWAQADILLAADFLYRGGLYAQTPGASLPDYLATTQSLLPHIGPDTRIFGAHGDADDPVQAAPPLLAHTDLAALETSLCRLRDAPPKDEAEHEWPVSDAVSLITGAEAFGAWRSR